MKAIVVRGSQLGLLVLMAMAFSSRGHDVHPTTVAAVVTAAGATLTLPTPGALLAPPTILDNAPTPAPTQVVVQRASTPKPLATASAPRSSRPVVADHAYASPSWNSAYLTCDSYAISGQVTDSGGLIWLHVDCGYVPIHN